MQVLFGVQDATDAADRGRRGPDRRLRPDETLELVIHSNACGPNPKVANLVGMQDRIRHDVVVLADSDIAVARDYLRENRRRAEPSRRRPRHVPLPRRAASRPVGASCQHGDRLPFPPRRSRRAQRSASRGRVSVRRSRSAARRSRRLADSRRSSTISPTTTRSVKPCAPPACRWRYRPSWLPTLAPSGAPANCCATSSAGRGPCGQ